MGTMKKLLVVVAVAIIMQVIVIGAPGQVSAIVCPAGYHVVGTKCVPNTSSALSGKTVNPGGIDWDAIGIFQMPSFNLTSAETIFMDSSALLTITAPIGNRAGTLMTEGTIFGAGSLIGNMINNGVLDIALTDIFSITGDFNQGSTGALDVTIGKSGNSLFNVSGEAVLDGKLNIALADNLVPEIGAEFLILDPSIISGAFDSITHGWTVDVRNTSNGQEMFAEFTGVPEPSTIILFGGGLAGLAFVGFRRKNRTGTK